MTDIVERLDENDPVDMEAKAEIERLRAALQKIADLTAFFDPNSNAGYGHALLIARQALLASGK